MLFTHQIIESKYTDQCISDFAVASSQADIISGQEDEILALHHTSKLKPHYILLSYEVKKSETNEFIRFLLSESSNSQIIVIGNYLSEQQILSCLLAGANGYMEYRAMQKNLDKAICVIAKGEAWVSRKMAALLIEKLRC